MSRGSRAEEFLPPITNRPITTMKTMKALMTVAGVLLAAGCGGGVMEHETWSAQVPLAWVSSPPPTAEMLRAARASDPGQMAAAMGPLDVCQAASSCDASYGSCTNFSAWAACGSMSCRAGCYHNPLERDGTGSQTYNRYRICFNSAGQPCTNWEQSTQTWCGC